MNYKSNVSINVFSTHPYVIYKPEEKNATVAANRIQ